MHICTLDSPVLHEVAILLTVAIPALAYVMNLVSTEQFASLCQLCGHPDTIRDKHDDHIGNLFASVSHEGTS
jgi:hypothetical protein